MEAVVAINKCLNSLKLREIHIIETNCMFLLLSLFTIYIYIVISHLNFIVSLMSYIKFVVIIFKKKFNIYFTSSHLYLSIKDTEHE